MSVDMKEDATRVVAIDAAGAKKRRYTQRARAEGASRTREAILDATMAAGMEKATVNVSLADVAERSGVSIQTVLRHFGSRDALIDEALRHGAARIAAERRPIAEDVPSAIRALFDHYEIRGDTVIRLLAQECFDERITAVTAPGRAIHREWVERFLARAEGESSDALVDQLVVVTDVYVWKLLRRDRGLSREQAEDRVLGMTRAVLRAHRSGKRESS
jgi:AcrR family transcriptional regulator